MIVATWIACAVGLVAQDVAEIEVERMARVEMSAGDDSYFVGEVIDVQLRFACRASFLRDNMLQSFRNKLDVPVQLIVPWWSELDGALFLEISDPQARSSFVLNGQLARATRLAPTSADWVEFQVTRRLLVERAGPLTLPRAALSFDYATRFRDSFLDGRIPVDKTPARLTSESLTLQVHEPPALGRPAEFSGAVGSFVVHGEASTTSVAVGEALVWKIIIEGSGNLHSFAPPKLERQLNGFHSRGRIENLHADRREFVYELVPLHELDGLPAIAFSFFDPVRERYETVRTAPIALTVGPGSGAVVLPQPQALPVEVEKKPASVPEKLPEAPVERADIGPLKALAAPSQALNRERLSSTQLMGFLSAPWILWLGSSVWRRRQQRRRISLAERRARGAAAAFRAQVAGGSTPLCAAYAEFIGARLHCPSATVIGPGLVERLRHADVPLELASECAAALGKLVDERFGGRADATGVERIAGLVDRLEALFAQPEATSA